MHSPADFAEHCIGLLKNRGTSGPTGPTSDKLFKSNDKAGTTECDEVGPLDFHWSQQNAASGPAKVVASQSLARPVTTGTTGTTTFAEASIEDELASIDEEWHAILHTLRRGPATGFSEAHWRDLIHDGERFIQTWAPPARQLGWTALDLFSVNPTAPGPRVGCWGLLLFIRGGAVIALTGDGATIRRPSKSILTFQRRTYSDEILLSEVPHEAA